MKDSNGLSDETDLFQMLGNILKFSKCALEKSLLTSILKAQAAETKSKDLFIMLAEYQQRFKSQPQRVSAVKVRALAGEEWDPAIWLGVVWEEAENFEPSDSLGFISPDEVVPSSQPLEILPISPFIEEINHSLSDKQAVTCLR